MYKSLIKPLTVDIKSFILDTLFPIHCIICDTEGLFICQDCQSKLQPVPFQQCIVCQKPSLAGLTHPHCQTAQAPEQLICIYDYHDENVSKILIEGKYKFLPGVYEQLGKSLADKINSEAYRQPSNALVVAMPLHKQRRRWRGFNQAEVLSKQLNKICGFALGDMLERQKNTRTQKDLKKDQRLENVIGAFAIKKNSSIIKDSSIILIDDVTTTGATLKEAAKVLKRNGAKKVVCLAVAKD